MSRSSPIKARAFGVSIQLMTINQSAHPSERLGRAPGDRLPLAILLGMAAIAFAGNIGAGIPW